MINEEILNYYQNLYKESEEWRPTSSFEEVARLTEADMELLEKVFEEDEVLSVIQSCALDKAPGPDGFTMTFFQKSWVSLRRRSWGPSTTSTSIATW